MLKYGMTFLLRVLSICIDTTVILGDILLFLAFIIGQSIIQFGHLVISALHLIFLCLFTLLFRIGDRVQSFGSFSRALSGKIPKIIPKRNFTKRLQYLLLGVVIGISIFLVNQTYIFVKQLPDPSLIGVVNYPVSTKIYDRNNILLYEIYRDEKRTPVVLDSLPKFILDGTVAIEDKSFYQHSGVSLIGGIGRAIKDSLISGSLQGGSTITQQLVKTSLLTPERTVLRKIREICIALWAERIYTKRQILEMYLNQVPYGGSSYGIEQASKTYFGKSAKDLTLDEGAFLVGLPKAPSTYSPYSNPSLARRRRDEVLKAMHEQGYIDQKAYDSSAQRPLEVKVPNQYIKSPHFVFYVKALLEKMYGVRKVEEGGLSVITSIDSKLQAHAEDIVKNELQKIQPYNVDNAGILVTLPSTGEILAMVGSTDYYKEPYGAYNVTTASRQPGSSIKPIMYALALQKGYTAATILQDSPITFNNLGAKPYTPVNYDGSYHGNVPLRYALGNSYNIPAVRTLNTLGVRPFIDFATMMGITTWKDPSRYGLSITLGGGEVKMVDMATAYGVLAHEGKKVEQNPILSVKDYHGNLLYIASSKEEQVIDPRIAFILSSILSDNNARTWAFGPHSLLEIPERQVAVKTGTSNDKRDNWTIGYSDTYLATVWVGNHDNTPMNPAITSGVTGAAPIWHSVMEYLLTDYASQVKSEPSKTFIEPEGIIKKPCYFGRVEYFIAGTEDLGCRKELVPSPTGIGNN
ncbi:MAG: PBP1A family penicillin-binding protein [Candidatus Roizmanbacteria bacterium]